jgi:hypothetical protein
MLESVGRGGFGKAYGTKCGPKESAIRPVDQLTSRLTLPHRALEKSSCCLHYRCAGAVVNISSQIAARMKMPV